MVVFFVKYWNVVSLLWDIGSLKADIQIVSDASGFLGCTFKNRQWLQFK